MNSQPPPATEKADKSSRVNISYVPTLVPELIDEHKGMVKHLAQVLSSFDRKEISMTKKLLDQFKQETIAHVYKETTKLYLYLQYALTDQPDKFTKMRRMRKEMDSIVAYTMTFLEKYETLETDRQKQNTFQAEMEELRDRWLKRVETEESLLFPLYQP